MSIPASDAIGGGHIAVLEWCLARGFELEYDSDAFSNVCEFNRLEVLLWLKQHDLPLKFNGTSLVEAACQSGAVDVLRFWYEHQPETFAPTHGALEATCYKDKVDVLKFLSTIPEGKSAIANLDESAFRSACLFGATRVLQWWLDESGVPLPLQGLERLSAVALQAPAATNPATTARRDDRTLRGYYNDKTVVWFLENDLFDFANTMRDLVLYSFELQVLDRLARLGVQFDDLNPRRGYVRGYVLDNASKRGDMGMLDWWKRYVSRGSARSVPLRYTEKAIDSATSEGYVGVLHWWQKSRLEYRYSVDEKAKEDGPSFELTWAATKWWEDQGLVGGEEGE